VRPADAYVFSRATYIPRCLDRARAVVIPPSIDPCSAKNQRLTDEACRAILVEAGIVSGVPHPEAACFTREDGSPGRVDRTADVVAVGQPPPLQTPLVVQVSRWDRLKDPVGVLRGFGRLGDVDAQLILAGPGVGSVADDPEGAAVFDETRDAWRALPPSVRLRARLVCLPTDDVDENAAMVNALQRHASIIVQKSLHEGFGLTVTEGLWKARPVLASAVGGIRDQIIDGESGLLLDDPSDLDGFARALARLLADPTLGDRLGAGGHQRVLDNYLGLDSLLRFGTLLVAVADRGAPSATLAASPEPS
jgi:trehalose synthase